MKRTNLNFSLLRAIRENGWTQVDLVSAAGLSSEARLSRILSNRVSAKEDEILALCRVLGMSPGELGFQLARAPEMKHRVL